jgi:hypothetical protein
LDTRDCRALMTLLFLTSTARIAFSLHWAHASLLALDSI